MRNVRGSRVAFAAAYVVLVVGLFLALGGAAYAQTPTSDQYGQTPPEVPTPGSPPPTLTSLTQTPPTQTPPTPQAPTPQTPPVPETQPQTPPPTESAPESPVVSEAPAVKGVTVSETQTQTAGATVTEQVVSSQALPLTGMPLLATVLLGGALVLFGLALRRRERSES